MGSINIKDIAVAFGEVRIFEHMSLDIAKGEFIVLLGPSGCGKSTLLNAIAGLLEVRAGQIWIDGKNVTWAEPKDRGIAMVFQSYSLYPRMVVEQNLSFGLRIAGLPKAEIAARVQKAAKLLQLEPLLQRRPAELSGGQRQRVAIGRALVRNVDVFLFDEPLSNLDAKLRNELRVEIKKLHQNLGNTMIYVTHDQVEALTLADRIAIMDKGVIQQLASPHDIYHNPANLFVAGFIGAPVMNFLEGKISPENGGTHFVSDNGLSIDLGAVQMPTRDNQPVVLGLRPEHISVVAGGGADSIAGTVAIVEPLGAETILWTDIPGKTISVRVDGESACKAGQKLNLKFDMAHARIFDKASGVRLVAIGP